jgi:protein phosphatase
MLEDEYIIDIIREYKDPQAAADTLVKAANNNGGIDNISIILIKI